MKCTIKGTATMSYKPDTKLAELKARRDELDTVEECFDKDSQVSGLSAIRYRLYRLDQQINQLKGE